MQKVKCENPFLIICAGSSGSTLLSVLLDKHPDIACGPEIGVFNKPAFYNTPFPQFREKFPEWLANGLSTEGQVRLYAFFFNKEAYFQNSDSLIKLVNSSNSQRGFIDSLFNNYLEQRGKKMWGEKTGSNAYYVKDFLKLYPKAKIIHIVRDPRDVVCSFVKRVKKNKLSGHLAQTGAVSHWLYNNAAALTIKDDERYHLVKYEDLVTNPKVELSKICKHLNIEYTEKFFSNERDEYWKEFSKGNVHSSWNANPFSGEISTKSIGKYKTELTQDFESLIWNLKLTKYAQKKLNSKLNSIEQILNVLGYDSAKVNKSVDLTLPIKIGVLKYNFHRIKAEWRIRKKIWKPLFKF